MKKIQTVVTHRAVHLDEIVAIGLLRWYGEQKYPGVSTAAVRYVSDEPIGNDAQFDADGIIPVGCGRGRFDDKDAQGRRKRGVCAATLVAEDLRIAGDLRVKPLLDEVLACDARAGTRTTQLAGLVKAINRRLGGDAMQVIGWTNTAVQAIIKQLAYKFAPVAGEWGAVEFFEDYATEAGLEKVSAVARIVKVLSDGAHRDDVSVTELGYVLRAMQRQGMPRNEVAEWAEFAFARLYEDQVSFEETMEIVKVNPLTRRGKVSEEFDIRCGGKGNEWKVKGILIRSDSSSAHSVANALGYSVIACRRSTGHTQIFTRAKDQLRLRNAAAMLRWLDIPSGWGKNKASWEDLQVPGEHPLAAHWHFFEEAGMLFNGTETHTVPASRIGTEAIKEVLKHAFHGRLIAIWKDARGIAPTVHPKREERKDHRHENRPRQQQEEKPVRSQEAPAEAIVPPVPLPEVKQA